MTSALALLAGMLLGLFSSALPGLSWMLPAGFGAAFVFTTGVRRSALARFLAALLTGMVLAWGTTAQWLALLVPATTPDTRVLIEGVIRSVPMREGAELRFDLDGVLVGGDRPHDSRIRRGRLVWRDAALTPRPGERWRLLVRLAPFSVVQNFAGPDTARLAFRDGLNFAGRVLPSALNVRLRLAGTSVDTLRTRVAARIGDGVADPDAGALLTALAVGLTDRLSADQWRVFNATGTTHLVAISGLHVTMFALVAFFVARRAWRWLPYARHLEREPFAMLLGLAAAGGYALLSGFSVPAQRTWLMLSLFASVRLAARHAPAGRVWSLALIAVLCIDPRAPLSAGFWLSFVAVGVILMTAGGTANSVPFGAWKQLSSAVRLQFGLLLSLAPLSFAVFSGLSITGFAVNLVAIPFVSFVLVPLVLAGALAVWIAPGADHFFFAAAATLYEWFWPGLTFAADLDFALWRITPALWWFPFALLAVVVFLHRWPLPLRASAVCAALPLLFPLSRMPAAGTASIQVIDAGRASATLVFTHAHVLLFDTGDAWNTHGARLRQWVLPALDAAGRNHVDLLVLPSLDPDRAQGSAVLALERGLREILVGGGWPASSLPTRACASSEIHWDGIDFRVFAAGDRARACAVQITAGRHSLLLTKKWIEASGAEIAIATGGIANSKSRDETLARRRAAGVKVLDTRSVGGIELGLGTSGVRVIATARSSRYPFVWRRLR